MKPHDITQVPDVFVYLVADAGEGDPASWTNKSPGDEDRAAFARRSALSLAADGFVGARATSPRWTRLVADGAIGKVDPAEHTAAAVLLQARVSRRASRPPRPFFGTLD